jgi:hypothetical protein
MASSLKIVARVMRPVAFVVTAENSDRPLPAHFAINPADKPRDAADRQV